MTAREKGSCDDEEVAKRGMESESKESKWFETKDNCRKRSSAD